MKSFSDSLGATRRAETKAMDALVKEAVKLPEYQALEAAVVAYEVRGAQHMSSSHPASEVNPMDQGIMMDRLGRDVQGAASKLHGRLVKDGVAEDQLHSVMNSLNDKANAAGQAASRERK